MKYTTANLHPMVGAILTIIAAALSVTNALAGTLTIKESTSGRFDFPIVGSGHTADIWVDKNDFEVVHISAEILASDISKVTGVEPQIVKVTPKSPAIVIGTLGKSAAIDDLVSRGKLNVKNIEKTWESFVICTVADPFPGMASALVIAGSDRRGTAYGVMSLSEAIGVTPWEWWADVTPRRRQHLVVTADTFIEGPPSVKYRGIFINDEDWGLQEWAEKTFENGPGEARNIGPKTYAKIFELLLRLKANYLWPAMHKCTKAFNLYPENKVLADRYAIVMGSSHCEPLLRNNVGEWDPKVRGEWNYQTNPANVLQYWEERVKESGRFENSFTLGMRGVHDGAMHFKGTTEERIALMNRIIIDQRELLKKYVNPSPDKISQVFIPYKEVLDLYRRGLEVPEDVTLVWPDDNFGYIRRLSNARENKRSGGAGVYYHISYYGGPEDYLWLNTTPPALIWSEMHKAYENGARDLWVINVGDIKPGEIGMEFFLRMAWNITPWKEDSQPAFLAQWAQRTFGEEHAAEIAAIMDEYYRLNFAAKPEHMLLTSFTYGETETRLARFDALVVRTNALGEKIPATLRDAFFQLVAFPVRSSALMNLKHLSSDSLKAKTAHDQIQAETRTYNDKIAGGKWKHIMSASPRDRSVFKPAPPKSEVQSSEAQPTDTPKDTSLPHHISIEAEQPTHSTAGAHVAWNTILGLGRSGDSIALLPTTEVIPDGAALEYEFTSPHDGPVTLLVYALPTHAIHDGMEVRYAVSIDNASQQIVNLETAEGSPQWRKNVIQATAIGSTKHTLHPGKHVIKLRPLDPGLVFDKIIVDLGGLKPTHLRPQPKL